MRIASCNDLHVNNNSYGKLVQQTDLPLKIHDNFAALDFFVDQCLQKKIDRAVINGDIYDNPSPTNKIRNLFNEKVQRLLKGGIEVVIIVGNHDTCMDHHAIMPLKGWSKNVKVVEKPLTENVDDLLFVYVPHSQEIEHKKTTFKETIGRLKIVSQKNKDKRLIVFGHFGVSGVVNNDTCLHICNSDPSIPDLEDINAELILLGHFHERKKISETHEIYFTGDLERQSFSEKDQVKGFIIYDTSTKAIEWVDYSAARRMVEINTSNFASLMDKIDQEDLKDAIVKVRVTGTETDYAYIQQRFVDLSAKMESKGVAFFTGLDKKLERRVDDGEVDAEPIEGELDIFKVVEKELIAVSNEVEEEELEKRISLLKEVKKKLDSDTKMSTKPTLSGKKAIQLKKIKYHNFCRFGEENNELDFEKLFGNSDGIASVIGRIDFDEKESNGAGKSALLEGIAYAFYDRIPRLCSLDEKKKATTVEIVRTDGNGMFACDEAYVQLYIDVDGDEWMIKRGRKINRAKTSHSAILEVTRNSEPYNSAKGKDLNQAIVDLIGIEFEPFCNSIFFAQKDTSKIFSSTPSNRLDTILNVLGILKDISFALKVIREEMKKTNKDALLLVAGKISVFESSTKKDESTVVQEIAASKKKLEGVESQIESKKQEKKLLDEKKTQMLDQKEKINVEKERINSEISTLSSRKRSEKELFLRDKQVDELSIKEETDKLTTFNSQRAKMKSEYDSESAAIASVNIPELNLEIQNIELDQKKLPDINSKLDEVSKKISSISLKKSELSGRISALKDTVAKYEEILNSKESDDLSCPFCSSSQNRGDLKEKITSISNQIVSMRSQIEVLDKDLIPLKKEETDNRKEISRINALSSSLSAKNVQKSKHEAAMKSLEKIKVRVMELKENFEKSKGESVEFIKGRIAKTELKIVGVDEKYREMSEKLSAQITECNSKIDTLLLGFSAHDKNVANVLRDIELLEKEKAGYVDSIRVNEIALDRLRADKKKLAELLVEQETLREEQLRISVIEDLFGNDGLKQKIAEIYIPIFNKHMGDFLATLTNGKTNAKIDEKTMKVVIKGCSSSVYEMLSGGEKDVLRLASNLALGMVSLGGSKSLPDILFLDEVFGALAPAMQERVFVLIKQLRSYFKRIIVITHIPELQERFNRVICVEKINGISSIKLIGV